jgi:cysteine-rich repeat protein
VLVAVHGFAEDDEGPFELTADFEAARCGNGAVDPGEECDDGATAPGDGCSASCAVEACSGTPEITSQAAGDTTSAPSVLTTTCANALSGPERVYVFRAPATGTYVATVTPREDTDFVLAARPSCGEAAGEACADEGFFGEAESVMFSLQEGEATYLVVEGWGVPDSGPFDLEVRRK